ncbi:MAG TPA: HD domain-containing phosphohydrolase [Candidatus Atribacteria bacterium]|nr:HD domain-containing phosphohydrolase [Candidatus Atribacteria bacterium]HPT78637.1 HD domain-containing phosphohydrolase [Candidatus Atribacteria bacterium]
MNTGFYIGAENECLEKSVQSSGSLDLLGKGDGAEVMLQRIKADKTVFIEPGEPSELMEFFYILDGVIEVEHDDKITMLKRGDYFYSHKLKQTIQFRTKTDVSLIYFTTHPVFYYLSATIKELKALADKVSEKDRYILEHNRRVRDYALKIAGKLNLSKERSENLAFASMFHDLGKINIPDEILNKPGKLTEEEFELIKQHPADGSKLVQKTYYEGIADIIHQHHERLDGSGYPQGLKGDEILLEAKIIAVADTYDAMTIDRAYRGRVSPQEAVDELISMKGIFYDEKVVDAFVQVLKEENII